MSRINDLIDQLCPQGVDFKKLEELGATYGGLTGKAKADFSDGNARFISYKNIFGNLEVNQKADDFVKVGINENQNFLKLGDVLFTGSSETPDEVGMSSVVVEKPSEAIYLNSFCFGYRFNDDGLLLPGFSKYIFRSDAVRQQIVLTASGVTRFNISKKRFLKVLIPIPPLEVQREIVKVLDTFTKLEAELEAELTARKKQYNYYRDQLLSFEDGDVEWKTLGEICEIGDGNHSSKYPRSDEMVDQGVPFIRGTNMVNGTISGQDMKFITPEKHQELRKGHLKAYDVLMANRGEVGKIAQIPKEYAGSNLNSQLAWLRVNPEVVLPRYLFYVLNTTHIQSSISGEGGALQQLTIKNIKLIRIPVPAPEEQARIVAILDKFDALTNSITEGLPRELELRQKQYAYYRDLLLSFPKEVHP
jgi:type I restriction enzyme, S subunit